jgi:phage FluMu protein gp41
MRVENTARFIMCNGGTYVYVSPLPRDLADLKVRIIAAVKNIDAPMLTRVWQELEYRIDVCRVTHGAHSEHL